MYKNIIHGITSTSWAIMPEKMSEILSFLEAKINCDISAEDVEAAINRRASKFKNIRGDIAMIPLYGTIFQKAGLMSNFSGGTSTEAFGQAFDSAVANPQFGAIVIDVDSPGGNVYGVTELANKIFNANKANGGKPVIAVANSLMASAAYWIASAADEIVITPSGEAGSIGVLAVHTDQSKAEEEAGFKTTIVRAGKYKAETNPHEPLTEDAMGNLQGSVNAYYDMFTGDVAKFRGKTQAEIKGGYGEGRVLNARAAISAGLVDRIATMEQVIADVLPPKNTKNKAQRDRMRL